ncbi:heavy metal-binding domain-containing protein, partial [Acetobacter sp.]
MPTNPSATMKTRDPVCGMMVDPATSRFKSDRNGHISFFCSAHCQKKFEADPASFIKADSTPPTMWTCPMHPEIREAHPGTCPKCGMTLEPVKEVQEKAAPSMRGMSCHHAPQQRSAAREGKPGTIWTCPMHPQIRQDHPGNCPLCGMALEPEEPTGAETENPELHDFRHRLIISVFLAVPLMLIAMGGDVGLHLVPGSWSPWVQLALTTPIVCWAGLPFFQRGLASLRTGHFNMFTLIMFGVGAAFGYSLAATLAPGAFPASFRM